MSLLNHNFYFNSQVSLTGIPTNQDAQVRRDKLVEAQKNKMGEHYLLSKSNFIKRIT